MDHLWIGFTLIGALMQAVRTAAQRDLNKSMSTLATTYVRSLFGLPWLALYLGAVLLATGERWPPLSAAYLAWTFLGAMAQVAATMLLIRMFRLKNFGVGTMLTKSDVIITAILGSLFFSERLSTIGVMALLVILAGVVVMSLARTPLAELTGGRRALLKSLLSQPTRVALGCAVSFSISYLALREATMAIGDGSFLWRGGWTVLIAIAMQTVIVGAWLAAVEPAAFTLLRPNLNLCTFIGVTSAAGSIGWFTAFALQNASYVRAVGQIEVVFTLLISALYFRERITPREYAGIVLCVLGVVIFRLGA